MKMSGTDWEQYFPVIEEKKRLCWISRTTMCGLKSDDHLKLHGVYFPALTGASASAYNTAKTAAASKAAMKASAANRLVISFMDIQASA